MRRWLTTLVFLIAGVCALALAVGTASSQNTYNTGTPVQGRPFSLSTKTSSFTFTTSGFVQILPQSYPANIPTSSNYYVRQELEVNNPNPAHSCWLFLGPSASATTTAVAMQLNFGQTYRREWPIVPNDALQVFCQAGDSIYVDFQ